MFKKLTGLCVILALAVIVLNSYVRLSGAELACPEWPACFGNVYSTAQINTDESLPFKGFDIEKVTLELSQRYVFIAMGLSLLSLAVMAFWQKNQRLTAIGISMLAIILTGLQGYTHALFIQFNAMPALVMSNVVLQMLLAWLLFSLFLRMTPSKLNKKPLSGLYVLVVFSQLIVVLQILLGVWLSVNHGTHACSGFPQCNGQWLPALDYVSALNLINGFIEGYTGTLPYDALVAVSVLHRWVTVVTFTVLSVLLFSTSRTSHPKPIRVWGLIAGVLMFAQIIIAILGAKSAMPLVLTIVHHGMAVMLMFPLIALRFYSRYSLPAPTEPVTEIPVAEVLTPEKEAVSTPIVPVVYQKPEPESLYLRLKSQLKRTRTGLGGLIASLPMGQKEINRDLLEEIEASLIMADIGISVATDIIQQLTQRLERNQLSDGALLSSALKEELLNILKPSCQPLVIPKKEGPFVILVVGVNGAGKTTTIGKLAKRLQGQGHSVMLAAGDTFRAAAVEQLQTWGERNNIPVIAQHTGADSASVIYDALQSAQAKNIDVLIADTAGRLHTKSNLMDELKKVKRIMGKLDETAPHEVLLVLDAGTGQNALSQAKLFNETVNLSGLVLTKLDGTAKGGVIFALAKQLGLPIRYIGVGEGIDDLQDFDAELFIEALCGND